MRKSTRREALRYGLAGIAAIGTTPALPAAAKASAVFRPGLAAERARPLVGTIGHAGDGKTTLASALTTVLARKYGGKARSVDQITSAPAEEVEGVPIRASRVEYATPARGYTHVDCASRADCVKNMIMGTPRLDAVILVVSANDSMLPDAREQVRLARKAGVGSIVVFMSKCDLVDDPETLDLVEMEIREHLSRDGFPGDDVPVVRGSALKALEGENAWEESIVRLATQLDGSVPDPQQPLDKPFLMPVESVSSQSGDTTVVTGTIEHGTIRTGDEMEIVGGEQTLRATCTGIEQWGQRADSARSGESCRVALRDVRPEQVGRGLVLARPGSITARTRLEAEVYFPSQEEGGHGTAVETGHRSQFHFRTAEVTGSIELPENVKSIEPGDHITVRATLLRPVAMDNGARFTIREDGRPVGFGMRVTPQ
ncbi:GTP-binding protein [Streptomyces sp. ITFR-16]|uniref:GTP-binding protein n=1 Tax=Streptomyces sp. ITFR-16 TaxID=3075198 RepID=UPI00288BEEAC|nr:GTP-binding protein [Streptomyces sp. ITFR-16]WNI26752.1 GTP-binding protein [Streptomyces sp. ITFR-16]